MPHASLITGITGFAGSHLAEHLIACGDDVLGISRSGLWDDTAPQALRDRAEVLSWDLAEPQGLSDKVARRLTSFAPERVYHLAAMSLPAECGVDGPKPAAMATNVSGTARLVDWVLSLDRPPRLIYVSSCRVYASVSREAPIVDEDSPVEPHGGYAQTKRAAEQIVLRAVAERGLDAVVARAFQHAGPRQRSATLLVDWARQFAAGRDESVHVHTLDVSLDLCDVRDVVRAYRLLAQRGTRGGIYNVGSGKVTTGREILALLNSASGRSMPIIETLLGFKQEPIAGVTQLSADTDWKPRIELRETVEGLLAELAAH